MGLPSGPSTVAITCQEVCHRTTQHSARLQLVQRKRRLLPRWSETGRFALLDLDLAFPIDITVHASVHDHLASNDVGCQLCCSSDCQPPLIELDQSFNCSVNVQVLVARDLAFHMQARSEPRCRAVRCRYRWTHHILVHLGCSLPSRRSALWRLIRLPIFRFRVRSLRCTRFLVTPHRTSLGTGAQPTNRVGAAMFQVSSLVT